MNRTGKQCRERYKNHLCPEIKKGDWTAEEDRIIMEMKELLGNHWTRIAKLLPGRSDNSVKNRWHLLERSHASHDDDSEDFTVKEKKRACSRMVPQSSDMSDSDESTSNFISSEDVCYSHSDHEHSEHEEEECVPLSFPIFSLELFRRDHELESSDQLIHSSVSGSARGLKRTHSFDMLQDYASSNLSVSEEIFDDFESKFEVCWMDEIALSTSTRFQDAFTGIWQEDRIFGSPSNVTLPGIFPQFKIESPACKLVSTTPRGSIHRKIRRGLVNGYSQAV